MSTPIQRMLVVDPDDVARTRTSAAFRARGWQVLEASAVKAAIDAALQHQPHAIITALALPDAVGFNHVRALRSVVEEDIKIVGVGRDHESITDDTRRAGFDAVVAEPIDIAALQHELMAKPDPDEQKPTTKMPPIR